MILESLVRIEVPPLASLVHDVDQSVAVFKAPAVPASGRVIQPRLELQSGHLPEAAGGGDGADRAVEESPGGDQLVRVPAGLVVHHGQVISGI